MAAELHRRDTEAAAARREEVAPVNALEFATELTGGVDDLGGGGGRSQRLRSLRQ